MPVTFDEFEIELECLKCDADFVVTGKRLAKSPEVPCPACGTIVRVDVWAYHAQWARNRKFLGRD